MRRPVFSLRSHPLIAALVIGFALFLPACGQAPERGTSITGAALIQRIREGTAPLILDVRSAAEFRGGHVPGAVNIPHDQLSERLAELEISESDEVVVHCQSGRRAASAENLLAGSGYTRVRDLAGHWKAWREAELPTE
jgi:rhodanese-related sulfurtransferase